MDWNNFFSDIENDSITKWSIDRHEKCLDDFKENFLDLNSEIDILESQIEHVKLRVQELEELKKNSHESYHEQIDKNSSKATKIIKKLESKLPKKKNKNK